MRSTSRATSNRQMRKDMKKVDRKWLVLLAVIVICGLAAGTWYYRSKCHGVDACAAAEAESHERDTPSEPQ
jgi:hypothetical protein